MQLYVFINTIEEMNLIRVLKIVTTPFYKQWLQEVLANIFIARQSNPPSSNFLYFIYYCLYQ